MKFRIFLKMCRFLPSIDRLGQMRETGYFCDPTDGWAISPEVGTDHVAVFELGNEVVQSQLPGTGSTQLTIELDHQLQSDHNLGRFRIAVSSASRPVPFTPSDAALPDQSYHSR